MRKVKTLNKILFVSGAILILYSIYFLLVFPKNQGAYFIGLVGAVMVFYAFARKWLLTKCKRGFPRFARVAVLFGFYLMLATFAGFCVSVAVVSTHVPDGEKDAIIVLGAGLHGDSVSLTLAKRLDKAIEYYSENPSVLIVVSGGQGRDELVSEAFAMKKYLVQHGVDAGSVLLEDKSTSTEENFRLSKKLLDGWFGGEAYASAYVTNSFHCYRAGKFAERAGMDTDFLPAATPFYLLPAYCARDYLGVAYFFIIRQ
ncbi:MAG: YdcF family protein [Clostridiales bacterium]|nr:YdcF family protein [Clostridiales bacterium]